MQLVTRNVRHFIPTGCRAESLSAQEIPAQNLPPFLPPRVNAWPRPVQGLSPDQVDSRHSGAS